MTQLKNIPGTVIIDIRHGIKVGNFIDDDSKVWFHNFGAKLREEYPNHELIPVCSNYARTAESMVWLMKGAKVGYINYALMPSSAGFTDADIQIFKDAMKKYPEKSEFELSFVDEIREDAIRWISDFAMHLLNTLQRIQSQREDKRLPIKPILLVRINHSPNVDGVAYFASGYDKRLLIGAKPMEYVKYTQCENGGFCAEPSFVPGFCFDIEDSIVKAAIMNIETFMIEQA